MNNVQNLHKKHKRTSSVQSKHTLNNLEISFPKWVRERNITSEVCPFANAAGNQEHAKNDRNCNHNYHYNLHLLLVFLLFMIDFAEEKQKYFSNAIK